MSICVIFVGDTGAATKSIAGIRIFGSAKAAQETLVRYPEFEDGEWMRPRMRSFRHACCDCGLIHTVDFKVTGGRFSRKTLQIVGQHVMMRWSRNKRATASARRNKRHYGIILN